MERKDAKTESRKEKVKIRSKRNKYGPAVKILGCKRAFGSRGTDVRAEAERWRAGWDKARAFGIVAVEERIS